MWSLIVSRSPHSLGACVAKPTAPRRVPSSRTFLWRVSPGGVGECSCCSHQCASLREQIEDDAKNCMRRPDPDAASGAGAVKQHLFCNALSRVRDWTPDRHGGSVGREIYTVHSHLYEKLPYHP